MILALSLVQSSIMLLASIIIVHAVALIIMCIILFPSLPCSGSSYVNKSQEVEGLSKEFVSEKAPRSGVGVAANGSLFLLQVIYTDTIMACTILSCR